MSRKVLQLMGRPSKIPILLSWMKYIHEDADTYTRRFFTSLDLYATFERYYIKKTNKNDITVKGITTNINDIIKLGSYPYLKCFQNNTRKKKTSKYIFLNKDEDLNVDIKTIKFDKRQSRYNKYVASRTFATPHSVYIPTCPQVLDACPQVAPVPTCPQATCPQVAPVPTCPYVATVTPNRSAVCPYEDQELSHTHKRQKIMYHQVIPQVPSPYISHPFYQPPLNNLPTIRLYQGESLTA